MACRDGTRSGLSMPLTGLSSTTPIPWVDRLYKSAQVLRALGINRTQFNEPGRQKPIDHCFDECYNQSEMSAVPTAALGREGKV